jgi:hypothetical protein
MYRQIYTHLCIRHGVQTSLIYWQGQCVCDALFIKGRGKKIQAGSLFWGRVFRIFGPFPWPTGLGLGSQILKGLFSDPSPIHI